MTGDTFYRPIADIDLPEFAHLKDGQVVLVLLDDVIPAITFWAKWGGDNHPYEGFFLSGVTHFSTHDPRPIGEPIK